MSFNLLITLGVVQGGKRLRQGAVSAAGL